MKSTGRGSRHTSYGQTKYLFPHGSFTTSLGPLVIRTRRRDAFASYVCLTDHVPYSSQTLGSCRLKFDIQYVWDDTFYLEEFFLRNIPFYHMGSGTLVMQSSIRT